MGMDYSKIDEWILREDSFDGDHLGKCEAVMCLGNGYLGLRSATEEKYLNETRDLLINGTFDQFDPSIANELPNAPDMTAVELWINGDRFSLEQGQTQEYSRELNIRAAELTRRVLWTAPNGAQLRLKFQRVVSLSHLHDFALKITVTPVTKDVTVKVRSGIDGRVTNSGAQHFTDGDKRFYDGQYIQYVPRTVQSGITFVENTAHRFFRNGEPFEEPTQIYMELRKAYGEYTFDVKKGGTLTIEKYCNIYTTRDLDVEGKSVPELQAFSLEKIRELSECGYDAIAAETEKDWKEQIWDRVPITIEGSDYDQFAIRYAQYQLRLMMPAHDPRMSIGAKGLSGEGYLGHIFWDTEIFLLPYYTFTQPEMARSLEEYRYLSLPSAHRKAEQNGYAGAMVPWQTAWLDDGEVTPDHKSVDVVTGKPIKIWTGPIEQHVTADVAFGVWQYYMITGDQDYMDKYGYELIFDTAKFWVSRLEDKCRQVQGHINPETGDTEFTETVTEDGLYHICDIIGPDEYKEHKTDNAFTNYLAVWNMHQAMAYYEELKEEKPALFEKLNRKMDLDQYDRLWKEKSDKVFLPVPNENNVLPQDSTYLTLKDIDLSKYKAQDFVGGILRDYNLLQISQLQVSKQADVLVLFFLLEDLFPQEVKAAIWEYYSVRCLHDSSLSKCTHAVLAADMRQMDMAYDFFEESTKIDMGPVMTTSDDGIHAASFGGIWQGVVYGFGGLRMLGGKLRIDPALPDAWNRLSYTLLFQGQKLTVEVTKKQVKVTNETGTAPIVLGLCGKEQTLKDVLTCDL